MTVPDPPRATARLQFNAGFTLDDAAATVPYYAALGISHIYASPLLAARAGSSHGYDVIDPGRINPELGGLEALRRLVAALRAHGMGLVLDIVPNHMAASIENPWWRDVLEWGRDSDYADYFDIDWNSPDADLHGRVLVPTLGRERDDILAEGGFHLQLDADDAQAGARADLIASASPTAPAQPQSTAQVQPRHGGSTARIYLVTADQRFPLAARAYARVLGGVDELVGLARLFDSAAPGEPFERALAALHVHARTGHGRAALDAALARYASASPSGRERVDALLSRQPYLLAHWTDAWRRINWRRFFDINELVAIRPDREHVFEASHALVLQLYAQGLVDGLRIDHIDGLVDPRGYCRRLRERLHAVQHQRPAEAARGPAWLIVEKILAPDETLRGDWPVDGTTGYEFMDQVGALLHDLDGAAPMAQLWQELAGPADYATQALAARRQMTLQNFAADLDATVRALQALSGRADAPIAPEALRMALVELIVHFPVYRTYVDAAGCDRLDVQILARAARSARVSGAEFDDATMALLLRWLSGDAPPGAADETAYAITCFQRLTPPVAAKAIEDTTFYRYGRLLSRNEVGAEPDHFALSVDAFHEACRQRQRTTPYTLLATATHDHKRGEDTRARLAVLSELPQVWSTRVHAWRARNVGLRSDVDGAPAPDAADELMLYQMLVGAWPLGLAADDGGGADAFAARIGGWQQKSLREAKRHSGWAQPNEPYEAACQRFLHACLSCEPGNGFVSELAHFAQSIAAAGALNSLTQSVLRLTTPGVPDLYQGTEFWDFSLVDPDNRAAVDYPAREAGLREQPPLEQLFHQWRDGRLKQRLIGRVLATRRECPALFADGDYHPLTLRGARATHAIAFQRRHRDEVAVVIAPRLGWPLLGPDAQTPRIDPQRWEDTTLDLPPGQWREALTGHTRRLAGATLVRELLDPWPMSVLIGQARG
ncbi:malto-oligosyltrehalose synthase [Lysobacter sp. D1-1-M9]|uniref:malto-oligosyltrehalose synthase n=1 Tax=Novilysobacter longmucuonensis TaxID=3098603 RepID=UPI002FCC5FF4